MICVELSFTDEPARLAARPAHRNRLRALHEQGALLLAGPWDGDSGALLVFTGDRAEVDRLMADDPYFTIAGVDVVAVRGWRPVIGPGRFAGGVDGGYGRSVLLTVIGWAGRPW